MTNCLLFGGPGVFPGGICRFCRVVNQDLRILPKWLYLFAEFTKQYPLIYEENLRFFCPSLHSITWYPSFPCLGMSGLAQSGRDYRSFQSPVKNQANRGTCTAFSILAAMETLPGFPVDLSEQYVYAQVKMNYYKEFAEYGEGAMLKYYINILESDGTVR